MAFQMAYTDDSGTSYAQSYWIPAQINIGITTKTAIMTFSGYRDAAAFTAGFSPIASKAYRLLPEDFLAYFGPTVLSQAGNTPMHQTYVYALATLESDGQSFFATATMV